MTVEHGCRDQGANLSFESVLHCYGPRGPESLCTFNWGLLPMSGPPVPQRQIIFSMVCSFSDRTSALHTFLG